MARQVRIEYAGAFYHVMARGDRRELIVENEGDRGDFLATFGRVCAKTGWRVHAWVLMSNHYHWLIETPEANLVEGMKWFQNTFTRRTNVRKGRWGHVFGGRYKAVILDPEDSGGYYFERLVDYIHLNPVRAGLVEPSHGKGLLEFPWSSLSMGYAVAPSKRQPWMEVKEGLAASGCKDTAAGRRRYVDGLEKRWSLEQKGGPKDEAIEKSLQSTLQRGWYWGSQRLKEELLALREKGVPPTPESRSGTRSSCYSRDHNEVQAERMVAEYLAEATWTEKDLRMRSGSDAKKVEIASEVWGKTCVSQAWLAERLHMKSAGNVSLQLHRRRKDS